MTTHISFADGDPLLDWIDLTDALAAGHTLPKANVEDVFLYQGPSTLLNRSAWIEGMGIAVKCATVFPENPAKDKGMINGAVNLFSADDGRLEAILDFHLVTKWKTAGDSLLAARHLARKDSESILLVGAGNVGQSLLQAYRSIFPNATFIVWNRTMTSAETFAENNTGVEVASDLEAAVKSADIIASATMSTDPLINGKWLRAGQHVDLIGAYRKDMREVDDTALQRSRVFVDNRHTTVDHIGELMIPIANGVISEDHVVADFYELDQFQRNNDDEITLFKNGGGAHLDLMTSRYILKTWSAK